MVMYWVPAVVGQKSILFNTALRERFEKFFQREDTLALGVCNGCQMLSHLAPIIPGAEAWPRFVRNKSERFEARAAMVKINQTDSLWFDGMAGSHMPIAVSHGEGRVEFKDAQQLDLLRAQKSNYAQYIDNQLQPTECYRRTRTVRSTELLR